MPESRERPEYLHALEQRLFQLRTDFTPSGDQPGAIEALASGLSRGLPAQVLLGVTGSGKTFTMANVIARVQRPTLVIAHNKTLAAQLYREFKELFPDNAVDYFVSYYDYYQPEAFIPSTGTYIEKDSSINDELEKMRLAATKHLLERRDTIVVASVSCIFGIGAPEDFVHMVCYLEEGQRLERDAFLKSLVELLYERNDNDFHRGTFRARGDVVDVFPAYEDRSAIRIEFFGDEIDAIWEIDALTGEKLVQLHKEAIWPTSNYVTRPERLKKAIERIETELGERYKEFQNAGKLVEAERILQRTNHDLEMIAEMGTCKGIENYSRHLAGRAAGEPPTTLIDYFADDFLLFIDESHVTIPQLNGMYNGDRSRKQTLVEYGFRLPSALDNRPLKFEEYQKRVNQVVYVSATPSEFEKRQAGGLVVEQLIRPTGLIDPEIEVRPARGQVDDLLGAIRERVALGERVLVTTLTKRMAEELSEYYLDVGVKVKYLHADVTTIERTELIGELRAGIIDVLIGINLLREGLDIPEVSLVAILDADKEGFLRSSVAMIQTCGRAARHLNGRVIMYADRTTQAMSDCIEETRRRREAQVAHNLEHEIEPRSIQKKMGHIIDRSRYEESRDDDEDGTAARGRGHGGKGKKHGAPSQRGHGKRGHDQRGREGEARGAADLRLAAASGASAEIVAEASADYVAMAVDPAVLGREIRRLREAMRAAAKELNFEEAAKLRDQMLRLEQQVLIDQA